MQLLGSSGRTIHIIEKAINPTYLSGAKSVVFTIAGCWTISNVAERLFEIAGSGVADAEANWRINSAKTNEYISLRLHDFMSPAELRETVLGILKCEEQDNAVA